MHFRLTAPTGQVVDEGDGRAELAGGDIVVSPELGQPLRIRPADVVEIGEPAPFVVRLRLADGTTVDLSQLGAMRTQLTTLMGEARVEDTASALLLAGMGKPERFHGALNGIDAELRLYDDALVAVPVTGPPEQVPYAFVETVTPDASGYRIDIGIGADAPLQVSRMARRTSEFLDMLRRRVTDARGRTSAFLGALLPGLSSLALRSASSLLRDGLVAAKDELDAIDPSIWPALVTKSTRDERQVCIGTLAGLGTCHIGFKQRVSVERAAQGDMAWKAPQTPGVSDHGEMRGSMPGGLAGAFGAGIIEQGSPITQGFDAPFGGGAMGSAMALSMLGMGGMGGGMMGGMFGGGQQAAAGQGGRTGAHQRADVSRGSVTPASTDTDALGVHGDEATVMAFTLIVTPKGKVVYEVLNWGDHATYVYNGDETTMRRLNRALVLINMHVPAIYSDAASAGSEFRYAVERLPYLQDLRSQFVGRAIHTEDWEAQLHQLL